MPLNSPEVDTSSSTKQEICDARCCIGQRCKQMQTPLIVTEVLSGLMELWPDRHKTSRHSQILSGSPPTKYRRGGGEQRNQMIWNCCGVGERSSSGTGGRAEGRRWDELISYRLVERLRCEYGGQVSCAVSCKLAHRAACHKGKVRLVKFQGCCLEEKHVEEGQSLK